MVTLSDDRAPSVNDCFYGSVTVGERGQIVIPSEARTELGIHPGDKLLVMKHPIFAGLMVAKFEAIAGYYDEFMSHASRIDSGEVHE